MYKAVKYYFSIKKMHAFVFIYAFITDINIT